MADTAVVFPPGRYGRRREPGRRRTALTWAIAALVIAAGVAIAIKLFRQYFNPPYAVTTVHVSEVTDRGVTVTFEVHKPAGAGAVCTVVAHTRAGAQVGRAEVPVPAGTPGQTTVTVTYTLATTARPVTGEVPGCGPAH